MCFRSNRDGIVAVTWKSGDDKSLEKNYSKQSINLIQMPFNFLMTYSFMNNIIGVTVILKLLGYIN